MPKFGLDTIYEVVHGVLTSQTASRDSYQVLAKHAYAAFGIDPSTTTVLDFLELIETGQLPAWASIERCSRDIQEHDESLRGVLWEERQKAAVEAEAKKQLREARRAMRARQKDDAAVEAEFRQQAPPRPEPWLDLGLTEDQYRAAGFK